MDTSNEEILNNIIDDENYDFEIIQEWNNQEEKINKLYEETKDCGRIEFVRKIYELEEKIKHEKERDVHANAITITGEDADFLIKLAHTRNTQDYDCCADPKYWMIQDQKNVFTDDGEYIMFFGYGEELYNTYDNCSKEALADLKEYIIDNCDITSDEVEDIKEIHDNSSLLDYFDYHDLDINYRRFTREYFISAMTGPFLTKEAAKQHLKDNNYHYSKKARTYGLVGWRNPEFERLMNIISKLDVEVKDE